MQYNTYYTLARRADQQRLTRDETPIHRQAICHTWKELQLACLQIRHGRCEKESQMSKAKEKEKQKPSLVLILADMAACRLVMDG